MASFRHIPFEISKWGCCLACPKAADSESMEPVPFDERPAPAEFVATQIDESPAETDKDLFGDDLLPGDFGGEDRHSSGDEGDRGPLGGRGRTQGSCL